MIKNDKIVFLLATIFVLNNLIITSDGYYVPVDFIDLPQLLKSQPNMRSDVRKWLEPLRRRKVSKKEKTRQGDGTNYCLIFTAGKECNGIGYLLRQRLERIETTTAANSMASLLNMFLPNNTELH